MDLQYVEAGRGEPLLLLHGHEQSATSWRWVIPALAQTHRVMALSLPGHGQSAPAVGGYAPGRDLAPLVGEFLDAVGTESVHLVGNGGRGVAFACVAYPSACARDMSPAWVGAISSPDPNTCRGSVSCILISRPRGRHARTSIHRELFAQPAGSGGLLTEHHAFVALGQLEPPPDGARWSTPTVT